MSKYKTLRTWGVALKVIGILSLVTAVFGVVSLIIAAEGFWNTVGMMFLGAPFILLLASWPIALGQAMTAIADIGDAVAPS